jgi:hypothetical protein
MVPAQGRFLHSLTPLQAFTFLNHSLLSPVAEIVSNKLLLREQSAGNVTVRRGGDPSESGLQAGHRIH